MRKGRLLLAGALLLAAVLGGARAFAGSSATPLVSGVDSVEMTVSDLDRAERFYRDVLGFEKVEDVRLSGRAGEDLQGVPGGRRVVRMRLGDEFIELARYDAPGRPFPKGLRSNDRSFQHVAIIVSDMDRAHGVLRARDVVELTTGGPQRLPDWNRSAGGIRALYFQDPDGHPLEVLWFPPGKGDPKWRRPTDRLFLGIDHTAIVVEDTERSLRFYRDVLGLRVAGTSENHGIEQERLNHVPGARLRITGLRAASGPGIEFLEYLAPRNGRPLPADERANDVIHRQTGLVSADAEAAARALRATGAPIVSQSVIAFPDGAPGFTKALLARDPDGHAIEIIQK